MSSLAVLTSSLGVVLALLMAPRITARGRKRLRGRRVSGVTPRAGGTGAAGEQRPRSGRSTRSARRSVRRATSPTGARPPGSRPWTRPHWPSRPWWRSRRRVRQIGSADADIDDITDRFARVSQPKTAANLLRKNRHSVENGMDIGHHVHAVKHDPFVFRCAQGRVQRGSAFGHVDKFALKHGLDTLVQTALVSKPDQQAHGLVSHPVF